MPKITFFLRSNNDIQQTHVIYCRVTFNGSKTEFSLKEKVDLKIWDQGTQRISKNGNQKKYLDHLQTTIEYKLKTIALSYDQLTAKELVLQLAPKPSEKKMMLVDVVRNYITAMEIKIKPGTFRNHNVKLKNLLCYQEQIKKQFSTEQFDIHEANKFIDWFQNRSSTKNVDTANRNVLLFKTAIQFFIQKGEKIKSDLLSFTGEKDKIKAPIFLTVQDLDKLQNQKFVSSMLERIRDLFLFQCYTGLSYVDLWNNWKIENRELGNVLIGSRGKNDQSFFIPLNETALTILNKYNGELPQYHNVVYNRILKELAMIVGIEKKITTHTARKTFATIKDGEGWSRETIAKMLGHRSIRTTELYYLGESSMRIELEMLERKKTA